MGVRTAVQPAGQAGKGNRPFKAGRLPPEIGRQANQPNVGQQQYAGGLQPENRQQGAVNDPVCEPARPEADGHRENYDAVSGGDKQARIQIIQGLYVKDYLTLLNGSFLGGQGPGAAWRGWPPAVAVFPRRAKGTDAAGQNEVYLDPDALPDPQHRLLRPELQESDQARPPRDRRRGPPIVVLRPRNPRTDRERRARGVPPAPEEEPEGPTGANTPEGPGASRAQVRQIPGERRLQELANLQPQRNGLRGARGLPVPRVLRGVPDRRGGRGALRAARAREYIQMPHLRIGAVQTARQAVHRADGAAAALLLRLDGEAAGAHREPQANHQRPDSGQFSVPHLPEAGRHGR